jgi:hypothetical protein
MGAGVARAVVVLLAVGAVAFGGAAHATERTVVTLSDPLGDNDFGFDARGDIVRYGMFSDGTIVTARVVTRQFDNPQNSYNWRAFGLGDFWLDHTRIEWRIDTNGDTDADYVVRLQNDGDDAEAFVTPADDPTRRLCGAAPSWHADASEYRVRFAAACVGAPAAASVEAYFYYETALEISQDLTVRSARVTPPPSRGYRMLDSAGGVHELGPLAHVGDGPIGAVDIEHSPSGAGHWVVDGAGGVHASGDAADLGDAGPLAGGETVVGIARTRTGDGYWLFTSRGRVLAFGDAAHLGDLAGVPLNAPVVGGVATPSGNGYYLVAADGGVFTFGDARFAGSTGALALNAPVHSLVPDVDGRGYWLGAADGGVFAFDAPFLGSMGGVPLNRPTVAMVAFGRGYLMAAADGGAFAFGGPFRGSLAGSPPAAPIVAVAAA